MLHLHKFKNLRQQYWEKEKKNPQVFNYYAHN